VDGSGWIDFLLWWMVRKKWWMVRFYKQFTSGAREARDKIWWMVVDGSTFCFGGWLVDGTEIFWWMVGGWEKRKHWAEPPKIYYDGFS
jgi:hypothetical protein